MGGFSVTSWANSTAGGWAGGPDDGSIAKDGLGDEGVVVKEASAFAFFFRHGWSADVVSSERGEGGADDVRLPSGDDMLTMLGGCTSSSSASSSSSSGSARLRAAFLEAR